MISQLGERVGNHDSPSPHASSATGEARVLGEPSNNTYGISGSPEGGGALFGEGTSPGGHAPLLGGLGYTSSGPSAPVLPQPPQQHLFPVLPTRVERQWLPPLRIGVVVGGSAPSSGVHNVIVGLFHFLKHFTQQFPDCICRRGSRGAAVPLAQGMTGAGAGTVLTKRQGLHPRGESGGSSGRMRPSPSDPSNLSSRGSCYGSKGTGNEAGVGGHEASGAPSQKTTGPEGRGGSSEICRCSKLIGFLDGAMGLGKDECVEMTEEMIAGYLNMGGCELLGYRAFKCLADFSISRIQQVCEKRRLDGLVIVGGSEDLQAATQVRGAHRRPKYLSME